MSDDCISRRAAIDAVLRAEALVMAYGYRYAADAVRELPAVQPERKKGKWIDGYKRQTCSVCKQRGYRSWNFCPNCGADMRGEKDEPEE